MQVSSKVLQTILISVFMLVNLAVLKSQDFTIAQNVTGNGSRTDLRGQRFAPFKQDEGTGTAPSTGKVYLKSFNVIYSIDATSEADVLYIYGVLPSTTTSLDDGTGGVLIGQSTAKVTGEFPYVNYTFDYLELTTYIGYYAIFREDVQLEFGGSTDIAGPYTGGKMLKNDGTNVLENDYAALKFVGEFSTVVPANEADVTTLKAFYNAANGSGWTNTWDLNGDPLEWYGLKWEKGRVTEMWLSFNNLSGTIPKELADLTELKNLLLDNNKLSGAIPSELGSLNKLSALKLSHNELSGSIPKEIGNASSLQSLSLGDNQLSGSIPPELGNLVELQSFLIPANQIEGSIPVEIGSMSNLKTIWFQSNQLNGSIPTEIYSLTNLDILFLNGNRLSGTISSEIGNMSGLTEIDLGSNLLEGAIPTEIGNLLDLEKMDFSYNSINGLLPVELANLSKLKFLRLDGNNFDFASFEPVSTFLGKVESLYISNQSIIDVENRELIGNLGSSFTLSISTPGQNNEYQWFSNNTAISEKSSTSEYTIPSLDESDLGNYFCRVTNTALPGVALNSGGINIDYKVEFTSSPTIYEDHAFYLHLKSTANKEGRLYYYALPEGSTVPSNAQVIAGIDTNEKTVDNAGNTSIGKNNERYFTINKLSPSTFYDIYVVLVDENMNQDEFNFTSSTNSGIQFIEGYPKVESISTEQILIHVSLSRPGDHYFVALSAGSSAPSAEQIIAWTDANNQPVDIKGCVNLAADEISNIVIRGFDKNTLYDIYFAAKDYENLVTKVAKLSVEAVTGIVNGELTNEEVFIYPNPATEKLFINFNNNETHQITITNLNGSWLLESEGLSTTSLDVSKLNPGVYLLNLKTEEKSDWVRFYKK